MSFLSQPIDATALTRDAVAARLSSTAKLPARQAGAERAAGIAPETLVPQVAFLARVCDFRSAAWQRLSRATRTPIGSICRRLTLGLHVFARPGPRSRSTSSSSSLPWPIPLE